MCGGRCDPTWCGAGAPAIPFTPNAHPPSPPCSRREVGLLQCVQLYRAQPLARLAEAFGAAVTPLYAAVLDEAVAGGAAAAAATAAAVEAVAGGEACVPAVQRADAAAPFEAALHASLGRAVFPRAVEAAHALQRVQSAMEDLQALLWRVSSATDAGDSGGASARLPGAERLVCTCAPVPGRGARLAPCASVGSLGAADVLAAGAALLRYAPLPLPLVVAHD